MGLLALKEDRPTPPAVYNWRVYAYASVASFASCMIGYDSAFIGTTLALPSFAEEFRFEELGASELALTKANIVSVYQAGAFFGTFFAYVSSYGLSENMPPSHKQWLIPFAVQFIPGGLLFLGALWIKESPRWLFATGKREEALANLCWIRKLERNDLYIVEEVSFMEEDLERYRTDVGAGFWKPFVLLKRREVQWRFFLGGMLFLWQNGSGINAINYYSPNVFKSIGIHGTNAGFLTTGIYGVIKTVITFIWLLYLIDRMGRRNLLLIGALGGSICMWYIGAYIAIADPENNPSDHLSGAGIAAVFFFYLWTVFYTPSWNGTPWVINSEIFDQNTRSLGQTSAAANNWFWNFIISRFTPQMFLTMGFGVYMFFASLMILSIIFVYFLVPETKTIPLEAMDRLFEVKPVWKANKTIMEEIRAQDEEFRHNAGDVHLDDEKEALDQHEVI
ncbi:putative quinate permease protein [Eutypa lata UCREL1]|uniref:Quinate transporter n=1 Tax=Eutypa lata (strain UCR-EL1) TaxID=1287681 RepID=M7SYV6_EUTLA|nr:putative quinate permease protein [Eutypa lata UCREL1]